MTIDAAHGQSPAVSRPGPRIWRATTLTVATVATVSSRVSFLAVAWAVLASTSSAFAALAVAGTQVLAYAGAGVVAAEVLTRVDPRRLAFGAGLVSAVSLAVAAFALDAVPAWLVVAAFVGAARGVGDRAMELVSWPTPDGDEAGRTSPPRPWLVRAVTVGGGAALGVVTAWFGATGAIWLVAMLFGLICVALIDDAVPAGRQPGGDSASAGDSATPDPAAPPTGSLRAALRGLVRDRPVRWFALGLLGITALAQFGAALLVVVWGVNVWHSGSGLGYLGTCVVVGMLAAGLVFGSMTVRLRHAIGAATGFVFGGGVVFVLSGLSPTLLFVAVTAIVAGAATWSVSPAISVLVWRRATDTLRTRIAAVATAVAYLGIPLGTWAAAAVLPLVTVATAIGVATGAFLVAMVVPVVAHRSWRLLGPDVPVAEAAAARVPRLPARVSVTLAYADGQWLVEIRKGRAPLGTRHPVKPEEALAMLALLDVPTVRRGVEHALTTDQSEASRQVERMRAELAELEAKLAGLGDMVRHHEPPREP
jgi:hypothetical protein